MTAQDQDFQDPSREVSVGAASTRERSFLRRHALSYLDVALALTVALFTCIYLPSYFLPFGAPRIAMLLAIAGPGMVALGVLAVRGLSAARWACGFLLWTVVAALFSDSFIGSMFGFAGQELSVLALIGSFGLWALAHFLSPAGRRLAMGVLLVALALNALAGLAQVVFGIDDSDLALRGGRPVGLTGNSAYFGALMAMGALACVGLAVRTEARLARYVAAAASFSAAVALSGTRAAVGIVIVLAVVVVAIAGSRRSVVALSAVAGGLVGGIFLSTIAGNENDVATRFAATTSGGSGPRTAWWADALAAAADRPIRGWGVGRFRTAIQERLTFDDVAAGFASEQHLDAHNIVIGMLVAVGIPGLALLVGFGWSVVRSSSGPLVLGSIAAASSWLLQPVPLTTLPVVLFCLGVGASGRFVFSKASITGGVGDGDEAGSDDAAPSVASRPMSTWSKAVSVLGLVAGLAAAGWFTVAEVRFSSSLAAEDAEGVVDAASMYPRDPIIYSYVAQEFLFVATLDRDRIPELIDYLTLAVEYEPTRPLWSAELGRVLAVVDRLDDAEKHARHALELQPTHPDAWRTLQLVAAKRGDASLFDETAVALCRTGDDEQCGATLDGQLVDADN